MQSSIIGKCFSGLSSVFTYNYYKYQNEMGKFINIHSVPKLIVHIMSNNSRQLQKKEVINSGAKYF